MNTCMPASHGALGQPCEPRCAVPSAPAAQQGPARSCLGDALLRSVLFVPSKVHLTWRRWWHGGAPCGGLSVSQDPPAPWQMAAALPPCSEEYKCAADSVTRPRQRCWLSSRSISLCLREHSAGSTSLAGSSHPPRLCCPCARVSVRVSGVEAAPLPRRPAPSCVKCNK